MKNIRERAIAASLLLAIAGSIGFMVAYGLQSSAQWQGAALAASFAGLMTAALGWARWILPHEQVVDLRDVAPQPLEERAGQVEAYAHGVAQLTRRRWLTRVAYAAVGMLGLAALFPIGSLGPEPDGKLFHSRWRRGTRLVRADGSALRGDDLNVGGVETIFPEGSIGDQQSMAVLVRLPEGAASDAVSGYIAYSKICTHAGCPVALYRAADHRLVCPCHQSIFDAANDASVIDGPADRPLPRLPIALERDGFLRATSDFTDAPGPGFWEHA